MQDTERAWAAKLAEAVAGRADGLDQEASPNSVGHQQKERGHPACFHLHLPCRARRLSKGDVFLHVTTLSFAQTSLASWPLSGCFMK